MLLRDLAVTENMEVLATSICNCSDYKTATLTNGLAVNFSETVDMASKSFSGPACIVWKEVRICFSFESFPDQNNRFHWTKVKSHY